MNEKRRSEERRIGERRSGLRSEEGRRRELRRKEDKIYWGQRKERNPHLALIALILFVVLSSIFFF